jgi:hypothetical protein
MMMAWNTSQNHLSAFYGLKIVKQQQERMEFHFYPSFGFSTKDARIYLAFLH